MARFAADANGIAAAVCERRRECGFGIEGFAALIEFGDREIDAELHFALIRRKLAGQQIE